MASPKLQELPVIYLHNRTTNISFYFIIELTLYKNYNNSLNAQKRKTQKEKEMNRKRNKIAS